MAAIIRETLVLRGSGNELNVQLRLGSRATAAAVPPALVHPQVPTAERRTEMPGRVTDADYVPSGTRHGAGRSLRSEVATRLLAARKPLLGRGKAGWRGIGG